MFVVGRWLFGGCAWLVVVRFVYLFVFCCCCVLHGARGLLLVVCCTPRVNSFMLLVVWWLWCIVCCVLVFDVCSLWSLFVGCVSLVVCRLLFVV